MGNDVMDDRTLNQFLDDLASGRVTKGGGNLDQSLVETMLELRSLAQAPLPEPSRQRVDRLVEPAMSRQIRGEQTDVPARPSVLPSVLPRGISSNGYAAAYGKPASASPAHRSGRRVPRAAAWFALAALLALAAGFGYVIFGPPRTEPEPPAIPAVVAPPGTPEDASEQRFDMTFPEPVLPKSTIYSWSTLYSVEPGLSAEYPGFEIESAAAALVWVQSGVLALTGEHGTVHRGTAALPEVSPVAGELLLGPGDAVALELGPDHSYQLRNAGIEPLVFAQLWLIARSSPIYTFPPTYTILDYFGDPFAATLPAASTVTMHMTRTTLAVQGKLSPPEGGVQSVLTEDSTSIERSLPGGETRNIGNDPVAVVVMTAEFEPVAGTPSAATPTPVASEATPST